MGSPPTGDSGVLTTKGDLQVLDVNGNVERLPAGNNDEIIVADNTVDNGLRYQTIGSFGIGAGTTFPYGGDIKSIGNYYHAHGDFTAGEAAALNNESLIVMTFAGKLAQISWFNDFADATTVLNIVVNGIGTVATASLTGLSGSVVPSVAYVFAIGDAIAIQYDSGLKPGKGTLSLGVQKV